MTEKNKLDEDKLDKVKRAIFLQTDPFLNAAQLRFGYALTLHQAQGNMFHIVIADAETDQGKKNEEYFRWLYTLLTVPAKQLFLWNAPSFDPISSAEWSYGRCKQGNVQTKEVIPYAVIEKNAHQPNTQNIDFPCDELANLYCFINEKISILGAKTDAVDHHDYQEVYKLSNIANDSCKIRFFYNKNYSITKIQNAGSSKEKLFEQISGMLSEPVSPTSGIEKQLYDYLKKLFSDNGFSIKAIEHNMYQEVYFLSSEEGEIQIYTTYNSKGNVTILAPGSYSNKNVLEKLAKVFGVKQ